MNVRVVVLISALALASPLFARKNTDVLVMKNGDRMTCQVKGLDAGVLYVSFDYIDGTAPVEWSKVARLQSNQLFIVKTEDGSVYTGSLNTPETPVGQPVKIQIVEAPEEEVVLNTPQIVGMSETSEKFWQRFNGQLNLGVIDSKGNQSTQYSFGSQLEYLRERWSAQATLNSTLSASSGSSPSTRLSLDLTSSRLLPWNNDYYSGLGGFLQSSAQGDTLQTTIGGGLGRYLKNTNQTKISVLGGAAWQGTNYQHSIASVGNQNLATAVVSTNVNLFRFSKTNLSVSATLLPALSGPCSFQYERSVLREALQQSEVECLVLRQLGQPRASRLLRQRLRLYYSSGLSWTFGLK